MLQTIQHDADDAEIDAEVEFTDLQLFPAEPAQVTELLVDEIQLPYDLIGAEPEAIMIRVAERFGLPQRLLVAPGDEDGDGQYRVLDDPRWVQVAREAGLGKVPVRVMHVSGLSTELLALVLGQQRPANVAAQVDALERLLEAGFTEEQIGRSSGMTKSKVHRLATLLLLDPMLRQALRESRLKPQVAFTAAGLAGDVQAELAATLDREGQLTSAQLKQVCQRFGSEDAGVAVEEASAPAEPAAAVTEDPTSRVRRQAHELLRDLSTTDLPLELRSKLAGVLEEIETATPKM
jgi:ParB-like chromosome segregation protein Spo0J